MGHGFRSICLLMGVLLARAGAGGAVDTPADPALPFLRTFEVVRWREPGVTAAARGSLRLRARGRLWRLDLTPRQLISPSYRAVAETAAGQLAAEAPQLEIYGGSVAGEPGSVVRLARSAAGYEGYVVSGGQWLFVEPLARYGLGSLQGDHIAYGREDVIPDALPPTSPADALLPWIEASRSAGEPTTERTGPTVLEIATEADYELYKLLKSSVDDTNLRVLFLLALVEGIFERDLGVIFQVTFQHVWATDDPYTGQSLCGGSGTIINQFRNYWEASFRGVRRDAAHMWMARRPDAGGCAYVGALCNDWAYGVSAFVRPEYGLFGAGVCAHELGHNFGAGHRNDPCPRNIMGGPGDNCGTGFAPESVDEMNAYTRGLQCLAPPQ